MRKLALLTCLLLTPLFGCSHLGTGPVVEQPPPVARDAGHEMGQEQISSPADEVSESGAPPAPAASEHGDDIAAGSTTHEQAVKLSLIDRIRTGFGMPPLESAYIRRQEQWIVEHPSYLNNLFQRADPFIFHIVDEVEKRGMPMEIALLPAIESAFKPRAISRSNASGLWQFIPSTGRHYGLRQDWWYDGRDDVIAATDAALNYLSELNQLFEGDWFLTLAAYNAGQGTVQRAIRKNQRRGKNTDYSSLDLRMETRRYVPKLLALKNVLSNPGRYGIEPPTWLNQRFFETLPLQRQIDLQRFAQQTGIDPILLKTLNAGFKRWATAPQGPNRIVVPVGDVESARETLAVLAQAPRIEYQNHRINAGDTLSSIANRYRVSVAALRQTNKLASSRIIAGNTLLIPIAADRLSQKALDSGGPVTPLTGSGRVHQVEQGDTLWSIARRYQVRIQELLSWNQIKIDQVLSLNQTLLVGPN